MSTQTFMPTKGCTPGPCPPWCTSTQPVHREHGVEHQQKLGHVVATAFDPVQVDDGFLLPGVLVDVYQESAGDLPSVTLEVMAGDERHASADLRPHEARRLAELLVRAADVAEGVAR